MQGGLAAPRMPCNVTNARLCAGAAVCPQTALTREGAGRTRITDALPKQVRVSHLGDAFLGDKRGLPGQIAVMTSNSASSVPTLATALGGRPARQAPCIGVMQARRAVGELHEHATASSDDLGATQNHEQHPAGL